MHTWKIGDYPIHQIANMLPSKKIMEKYEKLYGEGNMPTPPEELGKAIVNGMSEKESFMEAYNANPTQTKLYMDWLKFVFKRANEIDVPPHELMASLATGNEIRERIVRCKNFVIAPETLSNLSKQEINFKQDFGFSLNIPFPLVFVNFLEPIKIRRGADNIEDELTGLMVQCHQKRVDDNNFTEAENEWRNKVADKYKEIALQSHPDLKGQLDVLYDPNATDNFTIDFFYTDFETTTFTFRASKIPRFFSHYTYNPTSGKNDDSIFDMLRNNNIGEQNQNNLMRFALNIILYLTSSNIEYRGWNKENAKRIRMGASPLPPDFYWCKIHYPEFIRKMTTKNKNNLHPGYNYMFDVRGHYRLLQSERFKDKRGLKIWIAPFKKGHGIYIPHNYFYDWMGKGAI
jgi:hypothetical protein